MKYSKQQIKAINHIDGPALVLAVPGSGKTTVLLERLNRLLANGHDPGSFLIMTFSKAQALDMEEKFRQKYGNHNLAFSTIHSFAYAIVRNKARMDGNKLELIESSEKYSKYRLVERLYYQINQTRITEDDLEEFFRVSGYIKNTLLSYRDYLKLYGKSIRNFEKIYAYYEEFKSNHNLLDFDDMLLLALKILQEDSEILRSLQDRFKYLQIDEGQDTSLVQLKIISLIAKPENNIFIVADDDQSIYGFRGAESRQLLDFKKVYPQATIYLMEDNYRSSKHIVDLSNKLIKNNRQRYNKNLSATHDAGEKIEIIQAKNSKIQTSYVIKEALKRLKEGNSVAILYRNNISALNYINSIPDNTDFYIKDSNLNFYKHFIIRDLIDIINFSIDRYDFQTFERIYYKFNMYFKRDFVNQISMMDPKQDIITRLSQCDGINSFYNEKIDLLSYYLDKIRSGNFRQSAELIFYQLGYGDYLKEQARRMKTPIVTYNRIVDTILNICLETKTLKEFEEKIIKLKNRQKTMSKMPSKLSLTTIHGSKGLEYDHVFLVDLIEDEFPSAFSLKADDSLGMLEEERRLFYVAMTRAKKELKLITIKNLAGEKTKLSLFLEELTKEKK